MKRKFLAYSLLFSSWINLKAQSSGNALNFDGTNDLVNAPLPTLFTNIANNDFTMEAWIYPTTAIFSRIIFAQGSTSNFATMSTGGTNNIYFYVVKNGTNYSIATSANMPLNAWTHVACRWTAATNAVEVFYNGVQQSGAGGGTSSTGTSGTLCIGSRPGGSQYFPGSIDEVRIWSEARSNCEISNNYNRELTGTETNLIAYYNFNQGSAGATNTGITGLPDLTSVFNGTLANFALSGSTSNWISSGVSLTGTGEAGGIIVNNSYTICTGNTIYLGTTPLTTSGTYSNTMLAISGCDSINIINLTVNPIPTITVNTPTICSGTPVILTPNGANTYTITGGTFTVSPNTITSYSITGSDTNGCISSAEATVFVNPTYTTSNAQTICEGSSYVLNGHTYSTTGTYSDVLQTILGCDSLVVTQLTVNNLPNIIVNGSTTICVNETGILTASGANTYTWNTNANTSSISTNPSVTTVYSVSGTNNNHCVNTSSVTLYVDNCLGITKSGVKTGKLVIYPNPNNGEFIVETIENSRILVINSIGQIVHEQITISNKTEISLKEKSKGIYFVKIITNNNHQQSVKVIKE